MSWKIHRKLSWKNFKYIDESSHSTAEESESESDFDTEDFDPDNDAAKLRKAMEGFDIDEKTIIKILAHRTNNQRLEISRNYKASYGKDLIEDLKSVLSGRFKDAVLAVMTPTSEFLAKQLHKAISGIGTDEETLVEILITNTNEDLDEIKEIYQSLYGNSLENGLIEATAGHFRCLLVSLCEANREEDCDFDEGAAIKAVEILYNAEDIEWETDVIETIQYIIVSRSYNYLRFIFNEYERIYEKPIESLIESKTSGPLQMGFLAIIQCIKSVPTYFAERLHRATKGDEKDYQTLLRLVCGKSEIDVKLMKMEFEKNYGKSLQHYIPDKTSDNYKKFLLALLKG